MKKILAVLAIISIASALSIFSCSKDDPTLADNEFAEMERVEWYDENSRHLGHKWISTSTGAIMSTVWTCDNQSEFSAAIRGHSQSCLDRDTIIVDTANELSFVTNDTMSTVAYVTLRAYLAAGNGVQIGSLTCDSIPDDDCRIQLYRGISGNFHLYDDGDSDPADILFDFTASGCGGVNTFERLQFRPADSTVYFPIHLWSGTGYQGKIEDNYFECYKHSSIGYMSPLFVQYTNPSFILDELEFDHLENPCELATGPYQKTGIIVKEWEVDSKEYSSDTTPTFSNFSVDSYDRGCDATVSASISFYGDNDEICDVFVAWGCSSYGDTVSASYTSGKWRAKLDTSTCLSACEFQYKYIVKRCTGTWHADIFESSGVGVDPILCGICN